MNTRQPETEVSKRVACYNIGEGRGGGKNAYLQYLKREGVKMLIFP